MKTSGTINPTLSAANRYKIMSLTWLESARGQGDYPGIGYMKKTLAPGRGMGMHTAYGPRPQGSGLECVYPDNRFLEPAFHSQVCET